MEPITAILMMLAGTALQAKASSDAKKRSDNATLAALQRQQALQQEAETKALATAQEFNGDNRANNQAQLEAELTEQFIKPVESAQQINSAATTTQGAVSNDYNAAKVQSQLNLAKKAQGLARLLGKTTAAGRLRQNEALKMSDAASDIGTLASFARGRGRADDISIAQAGTPRAGMMLGGQLVSGIGSVGLAGALSGAGAGTDAAAKGASMSGWSGTAPAGSAAVNPFAGSSGVTKRLLFSA
jgi:hypothetical protein